MKVANLSCPNCGGQLQIDPYGHTAYCQFCNASFPLDDDATHIKFDSMAQAGYDFERGRQMAQSEQPASSNKVLIIAVVAVVVVAVVAVAAFFALSKKSEPPAPSNTNVAAIVPLTENTVINQFIDDYNDLAKSPIESAEKGDGKYQYFVETYGYDVGLEQDGSQMLVSLNQTSANAKAGVGGMRDVFHDVCLTLDPTISDAEIYNLFDSSVSNPPAERRNHKLGTIVINYFPDEKRGLDTVRGHLELKAEYPVSRR